jgi:hypothetical protein
MPKQKILIIDNVFAPSKKDRILNGVQKFSKAQREVLSEHYEVHYVTSKGSDLQFENQYILESIQDVNLPDDKKRKITKSITNELTNILNSVEPYIVLDNSCKHLSSLYSQYNIGIVFDHYHSPSMPLANGIKDKFIKNKIFWCGVSEWQKRRWNNIFDGVASVHMLEREETPIPHDGFGMFVGRWDSGKKPHVMISRYARYIKDYPLHVFTNFKNCYLTESDRNIVNSLMDCDNLTFHINASRSEILSYMKKASFLLGSGNESTGIVSLEGASYGVPYIVPGTNSVAEQEHMNPIAISLLDRAKGNLGNQLIESVERFKLHTIEHRKFIAKDAYLRYNRKEFLTRQLLLIKQAKDLYGYV